MGRIIPTYTYNATTIDREVLYTVVLTPAEQRVASLRDSGLTHREVAAKLGISVRTSELHWARISHKRGVKRRKRTSPAYVYFFQASNGLIKVGIASDHLHRFRALDTASPLDLKILTAKRMENPYEYEQQILTMFRKDVAKGEWLKPSPKLLSIIARDFPKMAEETISQ